MAMERRQIGSGIVWEERYGYCRAVRVGPFVQVAGTTAAVPGGGAVSDDMYEQAREVLRRIVAALAELGAGPEHVVRTRMFVTDIAEADAVGRAHGEVFAGTRPAATMVEVKALIDPALKVEIEADAIVPEA
jgi:enamine deaminase RidA (YjgF/YER057c/UK114 family)